MKRIGGKLRCLIYWLFAVAKIYLEFPHSALRTLNVHPIIQRNLINDNSNIY
jgi:hypothetical protein